MQERPDLENLDETDFSVPLDIPPHIVSHLAEIDRIAQKVKEHAGYIRNGKWVSDDWCGQASEAVSDYLESQGIKHTLYMSGGEYEYENVWIEKFGGTDWDPSHSYIVLDEGTIIDPTITQFTEGQFESYPHHPDVPNVAIIPLGHELGRKYEVHQTGYGFIQKPTWLKDLGHEPKLN